MEENDPGGERGTRERKCPTGGREPGAESRWKAHLNRRAEMVTTRHNLELEDMTQWEVPMTQMEEDDMDQWCVIGNG